MRSLDDHRWFARLLEIALFVLVVSLPSAGCAPGSTGSREKAAAPPTTATPPTGQQRHKSPTQRRAQIDTGGRDADCSAIEPNTARFAWLSAWCGFRTKQWALSARQARSAQDFFAHRGWFRRYIEMLLLEAISHQINARTKSNPVNLRRAEVWPTPPIKTPDRQARSIAQKAHQLWLKLRMPMHGRLGDRNAGDLPYLYALTLENGLLKAPQNPDGVALHRAALLDIARNEYADFGRLGALSSVLRKSYRLAVERGQLDRAIQTLERVVTLDLESEQQSALGEDLELFGHLRVKLGREAEPARKRSTQTDAHARRHATFGPKHPFGTYSTAQFRALLAAPAGRRQLADFIAWTRASPTRAIAPPRALMQALRNNIDCTNWRGADWRLGFQSGKLLAEHGQVKPAKRYFQASVGAIEEMRTKLPTPTLRQEFFANKRKVYMALVDAYVGLDTNQRTQLNYRQSLRVANALKARGLIDLLDGHLDPAVTTEDRAQNNKIAPHRNDASTPSTSTRTRAIYALSQLKYWSKNQQLNLSKHRDPARTKHPKTRAFPNTLRAQLPPKTFLLEYLIMPRRSYLWVISDQGIEMRQLAGREALEPLVEAFIASLNTGRSTGAQKTQQRQRALSERLFVELLGPAQDLLKSADRLIIAPDGKLYDLPFEMLSRPTRAKNPHYMVRDQTISYTPSSAVFQRIMARKAASRPRSHATQALLIGAADLDRAAIDLLKLAKDLPESGMFSLRDIFPRLPGARAELGEINTRLRAKSFEVEMRVGKKAAESWMRNADLSQYGIIHVAAHGISDARSMHVAGVQSGLEFKQPALLLSRDPEQPDDGIMTLSELLNRRTDADIVVLSGCTTGRGWRTLGAGAFGLAGAILYTGSRSVVASMWSVEDADTSKLMAAFYRGISNGKTPAQALQSGQIAMSKAGMNPTSWAAFRVIGGG